MAENLIQSPNRAPVVLRVVFGGGKSSLEKLGRPKVRWAPMESVKQDPILELELATSGKKGSGGKVTGSEDQIRPAAIRYLTKFTASYSILLKQHRGLDTEWEVAILGKFCA